ncbi:MAG: lysophospholipid acyltransferase family protein [Acidimicrobiales bacterium]|nr:lysophospholipid acyltransferase family protein [Acidimicrobiales bacterium]
MGFAGRSTNSIPVPAAYAFAGWVFRLFARWMSKPGSDPLPDLNGRATVMVANHSSISDVFYAIATLSNWRYPARCLVRYSYFDNPLIGAFLRSIDCIPAGGGGSDATAIALDTLASGRPVAIMPEGRVTPRHQREPDGMGPFRPGFIEIARQADAQILPVALINADEVWDSRSKLPRLLPIRRPSVTLGVGTPIQLGDRDDATIEAEVRAQMASILAQA